MKNVPVRPPLKVQSASTHFEQFYRPIKTRVTLRIDNDVLAWLKSEGEGYQTRINAILREQMTTERKTKA